MMRPVVLALIVLILLLECKVVLQHGWAPFCWEHFNEQGWQRVNSPVQSPDTERIITQSAVAASRGKLTDGRLANSQLLLGCQAWREGNLDLALKCFRVARATFKHREGSMGTGVATALMCEGEVQLARGQTASAVPLLRDCVRIQRHCVPSTDSGRLHAEYLLAVALHLAGKNGESLQIIERVLPKVATNPQKETHLVTSVRQLLSELKERDISI